MRDESGRTVMVALGANLAVAAAKFVGAGLTGSAALFAEGAQSVSDTLNEMLLLRSIRGARRRADERHPFGYGRERFFWALLAAVGIFVTGAVFSGIEAYRAFGGNPVVGRAYYPIAYAVLAFVLVAEGASWLRAFRQVRRDAARASRGVLEHIRRSGDPSLTTVAAEDTAAVLGVFVAAAGIALHQITGAGWWEGVAAAVIGILMLTTAAVLGKDSKDLLIGEAADPDLLHWLDGYLSRHPAVDAVMDLRSMRMGVDEVLVAARIDLDRRLDSDAVEAASAEIDRAISERWPAVTEVFLDATGRGERGRDATGRDADGRRPARGGASSRRARPAAAPLDGDGPDRDGE